MNEQNELTLAAAFHSHSVLCPRPRQQLIPTDRNDGVSLLTKFILCVLQQISRLNIQLNDIQLE